MALLDKTSANDQHGHGRSLRNENSMSASWKIVRPIVLTIVVGKRHGAAG